MTDRLIKDNRIRIGQKEAIELVGQYTAEILRVCAQGPEACFIEKETWDNLPGPIISSKEAK